MENIPMVDIAIIGAGCAGLSAAINGAARNKKCIVFGRKKETSWIYKAENVNNHLGMPNMTGTEMIDAFYNHTLECGVEIKEGRILQIISMGNYFALNFENSFYHAKTVILTTGINKSPGIKGEREFLGKGISYCATCDGMFYRSKTVVVVGEIEEAEEDADFLADICEKVYYVYKYDKEPNIKANIEKIKGKASEVVGDEFVSGININGTIIHCEGAFFIKESMPLSDLVYGLEVENNAIKVNRLMETNVKGVFAAGDCTGWPFQVSKAVGEGLVAAQQAAKYIGTLQK